MIAKTMKIKRWAVFLLIASAVSAPVSPSCAQSSNPIADQQTTLNDAVVGGLNALQRNDYPTALRLLTEVAQTTPPNASSARAAALLGDMYEAGRGVPRDSAQALKFYLQAAASGDVIANFNVGVLADRLHDYARAVIGYRNAAEKGSARAQSILANHYRYGQGVARDEAEMVALDRRSAELKDPLGEFGLAHDYEMGVGGLPKDPAQAAHWYRLSAEQGYALAQVDLGLLYSQGRGVTTDYPEAVHWFRLAAEQEVPTALNSYGYALDQGHGVARNVAAALTWYRRAAQFGQPNAMHSLAGHYLRGDGVTGDPVEALYWALLAERFYDPGPKRDQVQQMVVSIESRIEGDTVWKVKDRVAAFNPKAPPTPDLPLVQKAVAPQSIRAQLRSDRKFRLYSAVFAVALDADGLVLSLRLVNVVDPASGTNDPIDVAVPAFYIDAVRDKLSKKRPTGVEEGKAAAFATFFFFSPSYPSTVITDLDKGVDDQP